MKQLSIIIAFWFVCCSAAAQYVGTCVQGTAQALLDVNHVRAVIQNNDRIWKRGGGHYEVPQGSGRHTNLRMGIVVGGVSEGRLRISAALDSSEFWPGPLDEPGRPPADCASYDRIFEMRREDLVRYAEAGEASANLRDWPHHLGAPVIDGDGISGNYDIGAGDRPGLVGDQMLWWVTNDLGNEHLVSSRSSEYGGGALPVGLEVRTTAFGFDGHGELEHLSDESPSVLAAIRQVLRFTTFYRYELHYVGKQPLEDAWFGVFANPDLGDPDDDFVGSDSVLGMAFVFNGDDNDAEYGAAVPALGFDVVRGPVLNSDGRDNDGDGLIDEESERGGMTSMLAVHHERDWHTWPRGGEEMYRILQGRFRDGTRPFDGMGCSGLNTPRRRFMYPAMPNSYWSEDNPGALCSRNQPGDRRLWFSTGPFRMNSGDTEEIYVAVIWTGGRPQSAASLRYYVGRFDSVFRLKRDDSLLQYFFDDLIEPNLPLRRDPVQYALLHHYPNPVSDRATIEYDLPQPERVRLKIFDLLGREVITLLDSVQSTGTHTEVFNARELPPGIYFYELQAGHVRAVRRMIVAY